MSATFAVEVRRCLARRLTRVLIAVALLATAVAGVVVFVNAERYTPEVAARAEARQQAEIAACVRAVSSGTGAGLVFGPGAPPTPEGRFPGTPAQAREMCRQGRSPGDADQSLHLTELWQTDGGDAVLPVTFIFLAIGALIGGASMVGAEWKAATLTTMLTWEPRRVRVVLAKVLAAGMLAMVISVLLQLVFSAALLPTILLRGTTDGADAEWWRAALGGLARGGVLTGIGAVVGASVAMVGRGTAAALGVAFAYLAVVEAVVRAWKPKMGRWLIGENAAIFLTGEKLENAPFDRPVALAAVTLLAIAGGLVALAAVTFRTRDVAA